MWDACQCFLSFIDSNQTLKIIEQNIKGWIVNGYSKQTDASGRKCFLVINNKIVVNESLCESLWFTFHLYWTTGDLMTFSLFNCFRDCNCVIRNVFVFSPGSFSVDNCDEIKILSHKLLKTFQLRNSYYFIVAIKLFLFLMKLLMTGVIFDKFCKIEVVFWGQYWTHSLKFYCDSASCKQKWITKNLWSKYPSPLKSHRPLLIDAFFEFRKVKVLLKIVIVR